MNKHVVPLEKAEQCLEGFPVYLQSLRNEYKNPDAFGSINAVIRELDEMSKTQADFDKHLRDFLEETESTRTRFVTLAMLGINPFGSDWG